MEPLLKAVVCFKRGLFAADILKLNVNKTDDMFQGWAVIRKEIVYLWMIIVRFITNALDAIFVLRKW